MPGERLDSAKSCHHNNIFIPLINLLIFLFPFIIICFFSSNIYILFIIFGFTLVCVLIPIFFLVSIFISTVIICQGLFCFLLSSSLLSFIFITAAKRGRRKTLLQNYPEPELEAGKEMHCAHPFSATGAK